MLTGQDIQITDKSVIHSFIHSVYGDKEASRRRRRVHEIRQFVFYYYYLFLPYQYRKTTANHYTKGHYIGLLLAGSVSCIDNETKLTASRTGVCMFRIEIWSNIGSQFDRCLLPLLLNHRPPSRPPLLAASETFPELANLT